MNRRQGGAGLARRGRAAGRAAGGGNAGIAAGVGGGRHGDEVYQAVAGDGGEEGPAADGGRAAPDPRQLTQHDSQKDWFVPNLNQELPAPEIPFEWKGIFLVLSPIEFEEVKLEKAFLSKKEPVNEANRDLVKQYNRIRQFRLNSFYARKKGATKERISVMKGWYDRLIDQADITEDRIVKLKGEPVPRPPHFKDKKIIFG